MDAKHLIWLLAIVLAPAAPAAEMQPPPPLPSPSPSVAWFAPPPPPEPEEQVQQMVMKAMGGGSYLGVDVKEINAERAKALKLREESGVELTRVAEDSPAAKAGLKAGDVVLEYNGQRVEGTEQFVRLVRETPVGRTVRLLISRDGNSQTVSATIGKRPSRVYGPDLPALRNDMDRLRGEMERFKEFKLYLPDTPRAYMSWRSPRLGLEGESLEGQLADYFGVKEGVLVRSIFKDTPAEKAGLKAGDVVLKVDDTKVTTPSQISSVLRGLGSKRTFPLLVMRTRKEVTLHVTLEGQRVDQPERHTPHTRVIEHQEEKF